MNCSKCNRSSSSRIRKGLCLRLQLLSSSSYSIHWEGLLCPLLVLNQWGLCWKSGSRQNGWIRKLSCLSKNSRLNDCLRKIARRLAFPPGIKLTILRNLLHIDRSRGSRKTLIHKKNMTELMNDMSELIKDMSEVTRGMTTLLMSGMIGQMKDMRDKRGVADMNGMMTDSNSMIEGMSGGAITGEAIQGEEEATGSSTTTTTTITTSTTTTIAITSIIIIQGGRTTTEMIMGRNMEEMAMNTAQEAVVVVVVVVVGITIAERGITREVEVVAGVLVGTKGVIIIRARAIRPPRETGAGRRTTGIRETALTHTLTLAIISRIALTLESEKVRRLGNILL